IVHVISRFCNCIRKSGPGFNGRWYGLPRPFWLKLEQYPRAGRTRNGGTDWPIHALSALWGREPVEPLPHRRARRASRSRSTETASDLRAGASEEIQDQRQVAEVDGGVLIDVPGRWPRVLVASKVREDDRQVLQVHQTVAVEIGTEAAVFRYRNIVR